MAGTGVASGRVTPPGVAAASPTPTGTPWTFVSSPGWRRAGPRVALLRTLGTMGCVQE